MTKKSLFIWIFLLIFGFSSMPVLGSANATKHPGKTELTKKKKSPKKHKKTKGRKNSKSKKSSKKKYSKLTKGTKHKKRGSKNKRSGGKKKSSVKYSKKYSKGKKHGKTKYRKGSKKYRKGSKKYRKGHKRTGRRTSVRRYAPPTNNGSVEYRNYKRNSDADNQSNENIDKIAPPKEIKKEPKKEGE